MRQIDCNLEVVCNSRGYKQTKNYAFLSEFVRSGKDCVEVVEYEHAEAWICAQSLRESIKRFKFADLDCSTVNGRVYLYKKSAVKKFIGN